MKRPLKILLLLLLALTLPLRGLAAAMPQDAPAPQGQRNSAVHPVGTGAAGVHQQHANSKSGGAHDDDAANPHIAACSVSATCCNMAMSGTSPDARPVVAVPVSRINAYVSHSYACFIPEGPERPPRSALG